MPCFRRQFYTNATNSVNLCCCCCCCCLLDISRLIDSFVTPHFWHDRSNWSFFLSSTTFQNCGYISNPAVNIWSPKNRSITRIHLSDMCRGADKSLARPGKKQANVPVRMAWISFDALPCRGKKMMTARVSMLLKSRASLTCFRDCFLTVRAKDLSAPRYNCVLSSQYLRRIFLPNVQTGSVAHWASYSVSTGGYLLGRKRPDCESDHLPPSRVEWVELYLYFPLYTFMACIATALPSPVQNHVSACK